MWNGSIISGSITSRILLIGFCLSHYFVQNNVPCIVISRQHAIFENRKNGMILKSVKQISHWRMLGTKKNIKESVKKWQIRPQYLSEFKS